MTTTKTKINIHEYINSQFRGYKIEIARHIHRSPSWVSKTMLRAKEREPLLGTMKQIVDAINMEDGTNFTPKDFEWVAKK